MAGPQIVIRPEGIAETLRFLGETAAKTENAGGLYDGIGSAMVTSTQNRFEQEEDPEGNPWPASLRKILRGGRTLTDTARLVQSMTHEAGDQRVAIGTNAIQAAIHNFGGTIKAKTPISSFTEGGLRFRGPGGAWVRKDEVTIPRRAFLGVDKDDEATISDLCAEWLGAEKEGGDARQ